MIAGVALPTFKILVFIPFPCEFLWHVQFRIELECCNLK